MKPIYLILIGLLCTAIYAAKVTHEYQQLESIHLKHNLSLKEDFRATFDLGCKLGYVIHAKGGTKEDIARFVRDYPDTTAIGHFLLK